jgi:hypothetical protein
MPGATHLVCEPLLLEVEACGPKLGALVEGGSPRPRCKSSLHCGGIECVYRGNSAQMVLLYAD